MALPGSVPEAHPFGVGARRVPWYEPHHCNELFHALPPPLHDALPVDEPSRQRGAGWARLSWTPTPPLPTAPPPAWRERLGNLKAFKAGGVFDKARWHADQIAMAKRNRFSQSGTGRKRKLDDDGELVVEEPVYYRTLKLRVRFSGDQDHRRRQRKILNGWCGSARYTFNRALRGVNEDGMPMNLVQLRDRYVNATSNSAKGRMPETDEGWARRAERHAKKQAARESANYETGDLLRQKPWLKHTPNEVRDGAIASLLEANKALESKAKLARERGEDKRQNQEWAFEFKSKTDPADATITIPHRRIFDVAVIARPTSAPVRVDEKNPNAKRRSWTRFTLFPRFKCHDGEPLGALYLTEDLSKPKFGGDGVRPVAIEHNCKLTRDARGRFFLHVRVVTPLPEPKPLAERVVGAIDPGARTPFTAWGPTGHGSFGDAGFRETILPLCEQLDVLIGRRDRSVAKWQEKLWLGGPQSYVRHLSRLERRIAVLRDRIKNLVDDLHKRVARSLLETFDTILVPVFETQKMVEHVNAETGRRRVITTKTARSMMTWAHYRFRDFLKHKALLLGKEVVVCTEEYTTKGCSRCGLITDIGGNKTFTCQHCGFSAPRDPKSARDILAKHITA